MLVRNKPRPSEVSPPKSPLGPLPTGSLAEQFEASYRETWRLADLLVLQRADYEASCYPGLPMPMILQGIQQHRTCRCFVSLEVIAKDKERAEFEGKS